MLVLGDGQDMLSGGGHGRFHGDVRMRWDDLVMLLGGLDVRCHVNIVVFNGIDVRWLENMCNEW